MARLLRVSRSGYYAWAARRTAGPGPQATRRAAVDEAVRTAHERSVKTEFDDRRSWPTRAQARRAVARWIEADYNRRWLHSALGYSTPVEHENILRATRTQGTEPRPQAT